MTTENKLTIESLFTEGSKTLEEKQNRAKIETQILEDLTLDLGISDKKALEIVKAIANGSVRHLQINY